jgi:hypothetical protein
VIGFAATLALANGAASRTAAAAITKTAKCTNYIVAHLLSRPSPLVKFQKQ